LELERQLLAHHLPVPLAHARVAQGDDEREERSERLELLLDGGSDGETPGVVFDRFALDALGHRLVVGRHAVGDVVSVEVEECVVEPALVVLEPLAGRGPQLVVGLEILDDARHVSVVGRRQVEQHLVVVEVARARLQLLQLLVDLDALLADLAHGLQI